MDKVNRGRNLQEPTMEADVWPCLAVQIMLEELNDLYGVKWGTTLIDIMTNEQKKDWFLKLDPNGTERLLLVFLM